MDYTITSTNGKGSSLDQIVNFQEVCFVQLSPDRVLCSGAKPYSKYVPDNLLRLIPQVCSYWIKSTFDIHIYYPFHCANDVQSSLLFNFQDCGWKGWGEISYGGFQSVKRAEAAEFLVNFRSSK